MGERQRRVEHFEAVEVRDTARTREFEVDGATGVVVGVTGEESDADEPSYAVMIEPLGRAVMLFASELRATGHRIERGDVYDSTEIRVTEHGEAVNSSDDPKSRSMSSSFEVARSHRLRGDFLVADGFATRPDR